jgi:hypothetical protein
MEFLKQALLRESNTAVQSEAAPLPMSIVNCLLKRVQLVRWQFSSINEIKVVIEVINASALS